MKNKKMLIPIFIALLLNNSSFARSITEVKAEIARYKQTIPELKSKCKTSEAEAIAKQEGKDGLLVGIEDGLLAIIECEEYDYAVSELLKLQKELKKMQLLASQKKKNTTVRQSYPAKKIITPKRANKKNCSTTKTPAKPQKKSATQEAVEGAAMALGGMAVVGGVLLKAAGVLGGTAAGTGAAVAGSAATATGATALVSESAKIAAAQSILNPETGTIRTFTDPLGNEIQEIFTESDGWVEQGPVEPQVPKYKQGHIEYYDDGTIGVYDATQGGHVDPRTYEKLNQEKIDTQKMWEKHRIERAQTSTYNDELSRQKAESAVVRTSQHRANIAQIREFKEMIVDIDQTVAGIHQTQANMADASINFFEGTKFLAENSLGILSGGSSRLATAATAQAVSSGYNIAANTASEVSNALATKQGVSGVIKGTIRGVTQGVIDNTVGAALNRVGDFKTGLTDLIPKTNFNNYSLTDIADHGSLIKEITQKTSKKIFNISEGLQSFVRSNALDSHISGTIKSIF
jgi:hypothetical protein